MMLRPELVAACCKAMGDAVSTPITVKCRLGERVQAAARGVGRWQASI